MESLKDKLKRDKIPQHIAIIMDGNGRWAAQHGNARIIGHQQGIMAVKSTVEGAGEIGLKYLTLFAFSTENWKRPKYEVDALMKLLVQAIDNETADLMKYNVKLGAIGDLEKLPLSVRTKLKECIGTLSSNTGLNLILAISYSSKWEITEAAKNLATDVKEGKIDPEEITDRLFAKYLPSSHLPDPELMIRTSGEFRLSNFLLWQLAYSELYFTDKLWPDFRKDDLFEAVYDFQNRERRFGKISEQLF
ncbi:MAG: isoprenyl transferase [Prolixibacteraceae bacterium]|jgi:undecaprenyl diphosphate synthase|nr:isoprenyl transferase [Prolixibacteraceae bacterium]